MTISNAKALMIGALTDVRCRNPVLIKILARGPHLKQNWSMRSSITGMSNSNPLAGQELVVLTKKYTMRAAFNELKTLSGCF